MCWSDVKAKIFAPFCVRKRVLRPNLRPKAAWSLTCEAPPRAFCSWAALLTRGSHAAWLTRCATWHLASLATSPCDLVYTSMRRGPHAALGMRLHLGGRRWQLPSLGVFLKATEQPIDTSTAAGKAFFDMLGVFAEFETNLRRERQLEGVRKAKKEGRYKGTAPKIDRAAITRLRSEGKNVTQIARALSISRESVYRIEREIKAAA
jgi:hypothetical protein